MWQSPPELNPNISSGGEPPFQPTLFSHFMPKDKRETANSIPFEF